MTITLPLPPTEKVEDRIPMVWLLGLSSDEDRPKVEQPPCQRAWTLDLGLKDALVELVCFSFVLGNLSTRGICSKRESKRAGVEDLPVQMA